jgi:cation diffusion facilitator family transporter
MKTPTKATPKISLQRVVIVSFLVDVSDVAINVVIAVLTGSVTMVAQALEGVVDLVSTGFLLVGVRQSKQPADQLHPYGHGKELYFWAFLSGLATFGVTATLSFYFGLQRFIHPEPIENLGFTYLALGIAAITNGYACSLSYRRLLGNKGISQLWTTFRHSALIETKTAFVLDLMGTVASILGLIALVIYGTTGDLRFDGIGAMATGLALAFFALFILQGAKELLLGQSANFETLQEIEHAVCTFTEVLAVLDLRTIYVGADTLLVNMELHLQDNLTTDQIEQLVDQIETRVKDTVPAAAHIHIELETPDVV